MTGAVVIVALAVIFVPMLFEDSSEDPLPPLPDAMPEAPELDERLREEAYLTPGGSISGLPEGSDWAETQAGLLSGRVGDGALDEAAVEEPMSPGEPPESEVQTGDVSPSEPVGIPAPAGVAEPVGADDGMPSWVVQVASLGTQEGGEELAEKLRGEGYSAFVEAAEVRGRLYYRVRVGPEIDRARAEQTAERLRESFKDALIQRYP